MLLYAALLSLELVSRKGLSFYLKRSLTAFPFILSALPLIFTVPSQLWYTIPWLNISISCAGLERLAGIIIKIWLSVQTALLLTSTTTKEQLLVALRSFGLPEMFVEILSIMMRYLSIFQTEAESLLRARACRSVALPNSGLKAGGSIPWRAEVSGQMVGNLMLRSFERGERVYQAMLARGYNGTPLSSETGQYTNREKGLLLVGLASLSFVIIFGVLLY